MAHPVFSIALKSRSSANVFGLDLGPLTLGHIFVLAECESPFVATEPASKGPGDVLLAVFICSRSWQQSKLDLLNAKLWKAVGKWGGACRGRLDVVSEAEKFYDYLLDQLSCPPTEPLPDPTPGRIQARALTAARIEAPEHWRIAAMLMSDFHMDFDGALDTPLTRATALWAANGERLNKFQIVRGDKSFVGKMERSWRALKRRDAELAQEAAAAGVPVPEWIARKLQGEAAKN